MTTNLSLIIDVLRQDLKVAENAIKNNNFVFVSVIGNRIMSNLLADESKTKELMLIGWIVREISVDLDAIKRLKDQTKLVKSTKVANECIDKIDTMLSKKEYGIKELWNVYFDLEKDIRDSILTTMEDKVYTKKPEFTRQITLVLMKHFLTNRDLLLKQNALLAKGLLNDLSRVINEHGATEAEYIIFIVFKSFDLYFDYAMYSETIDGKINETALKSKIDSYINVIEKISKNHEAKELEEIYNESTSLVYDLSIEIRKYFINYFIIHTQIVDRKLELPEEAKQKIGETISKAFEEKLE
ncbi:MAG: hypothetical protein OIN87_11915 [Candidatus Methanoperedens sp.]|nr:hypothetical protein [Candidatus Methanoperedens sp.]